MDFLLTRNWSWIALRGLAAVVFGLLTLFDPSISLAALVLVWGAYAFVDGIFAIVSAVRDRRDEPHWVSLLITGIAGVVAGLITFFVPGITALALLYFIAAWAVITGIAEIVAAVRLRKVMTGEWMLALAGALSVLFGLFLFVFPGAGALTVVLWIGAYALLFGIMLLVLAFRLRAGGVVRSAAA
ncbi:MAG TPA: HdeD family acid-resistance protein [Gemmatimonadaceae bacterium]